MKPQAFVFIGRSGSGKGTQAKHLTEALNKKYPGSPVHHVETGAELRKFVKGDGYTAKLTKSVIESGRFMPEFMPIYLWADILVKNYNGDGFIIFDGTPRKLMEAKALESLFPFYELGKPWVIYLDIEHEESVARLTKRAEGRKDDTPEAIESRRAEYEVNVKPTVDWYKTNPNVNFLDIDGERPIEVIHADIVKRLGL